MTATLDRRRHPVRADLAATRYRGEVEAARFVDPQPFRVTAATTPLRRDPRPDCGIDTEALAGEIVDVYETTMEGWAWGQLRTDGYVGWLSSDDIAPLDAAAPEATHLVRALRTFRYPGPDLKLPPLGLLSLGVQVAAGAITETRGLAYARLPDGSFVVARHLVPVGHVEPDWVAVAESLVGTPYLWGGRSSLGLDCSALVQLAAVFGGHALPRDSDMQEAEAGTSLGFREGDPLPQDLRRGDLLFWRGHVGVLSAPDLLTHANGFTMTVSQEPLAAALARIGAKEYGALTAIRRL
ncbi:C40 family peptidase [Pannonibacter tanglangensis]|uniref:Glycoside hydrolase n=1 Tax=Pannonibacter tanglangensis TaxID=2750084 RepID=A0ABW9ZNP3_9HYPH|nr:NlpC/P60 family protein [Pannonibacter sp. XCT-34]NBN64652.1 glycoside hydrolase [Pannonibacter sp. XCT-34]